ncbi:ricin B-like lectin EULS3 [Gastrolobium bilobum]|uniref:ricin B-like lectin EULS3 n=1 Tax=Gastrolobium bilobum TaxID=150636 RepID=UPI002AB1B4DB|nr:ricin B-like lectin EULS3 [Gastrolobium bilobum]
MEFPFNHGQHSNVTHTHHHRRDDDDDDNRESRIYPPPVNAFSSFDNPPPPQPPFFGVAEPPPPPHQPETHVYHTSHVTSGHVSHDFNYSPPPPHVPSYHHESESPDPRFNHGYPSGPAVADYSPPFPNATVHHVSHETHHPHPQRVHVPTNVHHVSHEVHSNLSTKPTFRVVTKAGPNYCLTIRHGNVILTPSNPSNEYQHWYKDEKFSTRVKDKEGCPAFALVNKATGEAIKHSIGATHPVRLLPYNPDYLDESILWTESRDLGDGHRAIRMVNNIQLNMDAYHGDKNSGGVRDGTTIVLWEWNKGENQRWKILPY